MEGEGGMRPHTQQTLVMPKLYQIQHIFGKNIPHPTYNNYGIHLYHISEISLLFFAEGETIVIFENGDGIQADAVSVDL